MNKQISLKELLDIPVVKEHLPAEGVANIADILSKQETEPFYIRILIGTGAWFASLFFIGALSALFSRDESLLLIVGVMLLFAGIILSKRYKPLFIRQVCLVLVLAGNILLVANLAEILDIRSILATAVFQLIVCSVVYPLFENSIYRFLVTLDNYLLAS